MHCIKPLHFLFFQWLKPNHGQREMSIKIGFEVAGLTGYTIYILFWMAVS